MTSASKMKKAISVNLEVMKAKLVKALEFELYCCNEGLYVMCSGKS